MFTGIEILILVGIVLVASELFIGIETGFDLVLLGISLILGGGIGLLSSSFILAIATSSIFSILYIFYGRKLIKQRVFIKTHTTNIDKLVGKKAVVVRTITPDTAGLVRTEDEDWRASSDQVIYEKEKVIINSIEGVTLHVSKIK